MDQQISIPSRYCGPPDCANGGYVSGLIAAEFGGAAEITLKRPVPLDRPLSLEWFEEPALLCDGDAVLAVACPTEIVLDLPGAPSFQDAVRAARLRVPDAEHPFPGCFVCGPARAEGEGLRIFPGPVEGTDLVAAPWVPHASLADEAGRVPVEFVHAALDCPGGFAAHFGSQSPRPAVLGRYAAAVERPVFAGERYVLLAWRLGSERRKHRVASALFTAGGRRCGAAVATWVELAQGARPNGHGRAAA